MSDYTVVLCDYLQQRLSFFKYSSSQVTAEEVTTADKGAADPPRFCCI